MIGGSDDPTWDRAAAETLPNAEVIELPGADHSLEVPADIQASLANLRLVTDAARGFAARLRAPTILARRTPPTDELRDASGSYSRRRAGATQKETT